jgi:hypothetical protein
MMFGDLPPSSRDSFFRLLSALSWISLRPTSVLPVNATLSTSGCLVITLPMLPGPVIRLKTPSGSRPDSSNSSAVRSIENGVRLEDLKTMVLRNASAGASL